MKFKLATFAILLLSLCSKVQSNPIPAKYLFDEPTRSQMKFSPNGKYLSVYNHGENGKFFSIIDIASGSMQHVGSFRENESLYGYNWINDQHVVLRLNMRNGRKDIVLAIDYSDGKVSSKPYPINVDGYILSVLPDVKHQVLFAKRNRDDTGYQLFLTGISDLLDNNFDNARKIKNIPDSASSYLFDNETQRIIVSEYDEDEDLTTFKYRALHGKKWQPLFLLKKSDYQFRPIGFLSDNTLAVLSDRNTDKITLQEFDIATQTLTKVLYEHPYYDLTSAEVSFQTGQVQSASFFDHGRFETKFFEANQQKEAKLIKAAFPDKQFVIIANNDTMNRWIIKTFATDDPGQYYLYYQDEKSAEVIFTPYKKLEGIKFSPSELITVNSADGTPIEGILTRPIKNDNKVLLVMPHGGPVGVRDNDIFDPRVQYFASRGFSVLKVNFRGSSGYGRHFRESGVGQFGNIIEEDIVAVVKHVRNQYNFDQMCSMGASYGGYSSFMLAIKHPQDYNCIVASYGIYDLPLLFNSSNFKVLDENRDRITRVVGEMDNSLYGDSPVYLADKLQTPTLLIAGKEDEIASFEHTNRMAYVLTNLNKEFEPLYYEKTGHGHDTWWGEWHEHTYIYEYLLRTLNLPSLPSDKYENELKEALAEEFTLVADSFDSDDIVEDDSTQAWKYYKQAAQLGDSRAMYKIAMFYLDGKEVEKNLSLAMEWLNRASDHQNSDAMYKLGELYAEGKEVDLNHEKSVQFFQMAKEQGHHAGVLAKLAIAHCLGKGTEKSISNCTELLNFKRLEKGENEDNPVHSGSKAIQKIALVDIFTHPEFSENDRAIVRETVAEEFEIDLYPVEINEKEAGVLTELKYNHFEFVESDSIIAEEELRFGVKFDVNPEDYFTNIKKLTGLVATLTQQTASGETKTKLKAFLFGTRRNWFINYPLKENDLETALWTVDLFDLFGNKVFSKEFNIIEKQKNDRGENSNHENH